MLSLEEHKKLGIELYKAERSAQEIHLILSKTYGKGSEQTIHALRARDYLSILRLKMEHILFSEHEGDFDQHIYFPERS